MSDTKKLFVIFRDGAVAAMLRRNIELNDDLSTGEIIGIKDGSVEISMCSEELWNKRKKSSSDADKILFLGTSNALNATLPRVDVKYNQYGISYGWSDHVGILTVDDSKLKDKEAYNEFSNAFMKDFSNPNASNVLKSINSDFGEMSDYLHPELIKKKRMKNVSTATLAILTGGLSLATLPISNSIKKKQQLIQLMYFYGVLHFYMYDLEEFMNGKSL